jgi:hypothetical protein
MRRVAFVGATSAWVAANLTDGMLPDLIRTVSDFGYNRIAERGIPRAMEVLESTEPGDAEASLALASKILEGAVERERDALRSIHEIHTGGPEASGQVDAEIASWGAYGEAFQTFLREVASARAGRILELPGPGDQDAAYDRRVPRLADEVRGQVFRMGEFPPAQEFLQANPGVLAESGLGNAQTRAVESFINGRRSVLAIRDRVVGATGQDISVEQVARHLEILEEIGWIVMEERAR